MSDWWEGLRPDDQRYAYRGIEPLKREPVVAVRTWWDGERMRQEPITAAEFYGTDPSNDPSNNGA